MEQKFSNNSLDLETLREYCKREREAVIYRKGEQDIASFLNVHPNTISKIRRDITFESGNSQYEIRFGDFKQFS